ncbi:MAG: outer membrane protein assembly factor BamB family protein [Pirellulaceae bacterium]
MIYSPSMRLLLPGVLGILFLATGLRADDNWPQFRGRNGAGIGAGVPPVRWNIETGENIQWKTDVEGLSHSSPIIWGDRIYLVTAVNAATNAPFLGTGWLGGTGESAEDSGQWSWQVHAYDLGNGQLVWKREATNGQPLVKRHLKATHANCTPATDGQHVVAFFGSEGLYCYDLEGHLLWKTGFGRLHAGPYNAEELEWGFASSPVICGEHVIIQCDCLNTSFVSVLRLTDGVEVRRIPRNDVTTWSTPLVLPADGQTHIICNGYREMAAYDLDTGEKLWYLAGGGDIPVPSPLFSQGLILLTNGHGRSPTYAVSPSARGDLTPPPAGEGDLHKEGIESDDASSVADQLPAGLVWYEPRDGSYIPTPIAVGDYLYTCNDNGRLSVRSVQDGSLIYQQRVGDGVNYSASAVGTGEHLYFSDEAGTVHVIRTGPEFEMVAENEMHEIVMSTPAISGNRLLVRTVKQLVCIGQQAIEQ